MIDTLYGVYKKFRVQHGSTENMWYSIKVYDGNHFIEEFLMPTMKQAFDTFESAGYKSPIQVSKLVQEAR